jgi:hypothetical protein
MKRADIYNNARDMKNTQPLYDPRWRLEIPK